MGLRFNCSSCGREIVVEYLKKGDMARCRWCGAETSVSEMATQTDDEPDFKRTGPPDSARWAPLKTLKVVPRQAHQLPSIESIASVVYVTALKKASIWWLLVGVLYIVFSRFLPAPASYASALLGAAMLLAAVMVYQSPSKSLGTVGPLLLLLAGIALIPTAALLLATVVDSATPDRLKRAQLESLGLAVLLAGVYEAIGQLGLFRRIGPFVSDLDAPTRRDTTQRVRELIREEVNPGNGNLKLSLEQRGLYFKGGPRFTVILLHEMALCIKENLADFFIVQRDSAHRWKVKKEGKIKLVDRSGRSLDTVFAQPSLRAIKIWGGLPVPEDQK